MKRVVRKATISFHQKFRKKIDNNKKLTKSEEQLRAGLKEIVDDVRKKAEDRLSWLNDWEEEWEKSSDLKEKVSNEDIENLEVSSFSKKKNRKKKKRK